MAYITVQECKTYNNITVSTYDAQLSTLCNVATSLIDNYVGHSFDNYAITEYVNIASSQRYYPAQQIIKLNTAELQVSIDILSTTDLNINITSTDITLGSNVYSFASYTTIKELLDDVAEPVTYTDNDYINESPTKLVTMVGNLTANSTYSIKLWKQGSNFEYTNSYIFLGAGYYKINYQAGTLTEDIKYVCARLANDMLAVQNNSINPNVQSESITNYSYTKASNINLQTFVQNYSMILDKYIPALMFGSTDIY
jgi:hypothetical protein